MIYCLNGQCIDARKAYVSAMDNGFLYGDGIYETMRTYNGVILELPLHIKRLTHSAHTIGIDLPWTFKQIEQWSEEIVRKNSLITARVRITITRGTHGFEFLKPPKKPTIFIHCEKLILDPTIYKKGVSASTMYMERLMPEVKMLGLTSQIVAYRNAAKTKDYEKIFINSNNEVLEGASTNIFIVRRGVLITPSRHILPGLTRKRIIAIAHNLKIPISIRRVSLSELKNADEIFLTNRPREIIPIIALNGKKVNDGKPGPISKLLMHAYKTYAKKITRIYENRIDISI